MGVVKWTEQDIEVLKQLYPERGTDIPELRVKFSIQAIRVKAYHLGVSCNASLGNENEGKVMIGEEQVTLSAVLKKYGISSAMYKSIVQCGLSRQELVDRLPKMFIEIDGKLVRTVTNYVLPLTEYIQRDGKFWGVTQYVKYYAPPWNEQIFYSAKSTHRFNTQQTFEYLQHDKLYRQYTREEDETILLNKEKTAEEISQMLSNRSPGSVYLRATKLGLKLSLRYSENSFIAISRVNSDVSRASFAYIGVDGLEYCFVECSVCKRKLLMPMRMGFKFKHSEEFCTLHEIPSGIQLSERMRRNLHESSK